MQLRIHFFAQFSDVFQLSPQRELGRRLQASVVWLTLLNSRRKQIARPVAVVVRHRLHLLLLLEDLVVGLLLELSEFLDLPPLLLHFELHELGDGPLPLHLHFLLLLQPVQLFRPLRFSLFLLLLELPAFLLQVLNPPLHMVGHFLDPLVLIAASCLLNHLSSLQRLLLELRCSLHNVLMPSVSLVRRGRRWNDRLHFNANLAPSSLPHRDHLAAIRTVLNTLG